jgi:hypothetical protein
MHRGKPTINLVQVTFHWVHQTKLMVGLPTWISEIDAKIVKHLVGNLRNLQLLRFNLAF